MEARRYFIALNLPAKARERISSELCSLLPKEKFRVVGEENLHITLCFLGSAGEKRIEEIKNGLRSLSGFGSFEIGLSGIGSFGKNVIWLGTVEGKEKAEGLHARVCEAISFYSEGFSTHVTLARNKNASNAEAAQAVQKLGAKNFSEKFGVESVELMESVLSRSGPEYKVVESFML